MTKLPPKINPVKQKTHERKYRGQPSYAIPVWNGILEHRENIGPAIWEFLWCLDKVTVEDERGIGWLLGKTPIDTKRVAKDLNEHPRTAYDNLDRLADQGYILRKRTRRGYVIGVVNSKKFHVFRSRSDSQKTVTHTADDSQKTVDHDSQKTVTHGVCDSQFPSFVSDRKHSLEETVQEDRAVKETKAKSDSTADPSAQLYLESLKTLAGQITDSLVSRMLGDDKSGFEPTFFGDIRKSFQAKADDCAIEYRDFQNLYRGAMRTAEWIVTPLEPVGPGPLTQELIDTWAVEAASDPDVTEVIRNDNGSVTVISAVGITEYRVGADEPYWFAFEDETPQERIEEEPPLEHAIA